MTLDNGPYGKPPRPSDVQRLRAAGDALAEKLRRSPGLDIMRNVAIEEWQDAKQRLDDPYGSHLRDVVEGRK